MFGVRSFDAVINSPQAGILAVGEIAERPAVRDGQIVPAQLMNVTLSCDHRILYGAEGRSSWPGRPARRADRRWRFETE